MIMRSSLAAGMSFMNAARDEGFGYAELVSWFEQFLVEPGLMPMPTSVQEPGVGTIMLEGAPNSAWAASREARAGRIVSTARVRIAVQLAGLVATKVDDRFLAAAIFAGRVQRVSGDHGASWRAQPTADERLSDIVLSVFAADALTHRDDYERELCVCDVCGRVRFAKDTSARTRCPQHQR
jgi:hypothetical protein